MGKATGRKASDFECLNASMIEWINDALLDIPHSQERAIVSAGILDRPRYHAGKDLAKFGILCHQRLDHGRIFLKRARGIRHVGGLVLYDQVKISSHD